MSEYDIFQGVKCCDPDKRQRILDAAADLFAERGFHEVKVDEIALRADLSKGTIYLYFKNKEDLFHSIIKDRTDELIVQLEEAASADESFDTSLRRLVTVYLEFFDRHKPFFKIVQSEKSHVEGGNHNRMHATAYETFMIFSTIIARLIVKGKDQNRIRRIDSDIAARSLRGILNSFSFDRAFTGDTTPIAAVTDSIVDIFMNGVN
ncbi:TetR/AcrR family transcriptional regulator [bacterium]|nr:TetR/AcrR family transcriptional regulator [bacterium]